MTTAMEKVSISKRMEHTTTAIGKMTSTKDRVKSYGPMELSLKDSIAMEKNTAEGAFTGLMEAHLMVTLSIIKCLVMVSISGLILGNMTVNGRTICSMAKDTLNGQMGGSTGESTLRISARVMESFHGPMAVNIQVNGIKAASTAKAYTEMQREKPRKESGIKVSVKATGLLILLMKKVAHVPRGVHQALIRELRLKFYLISNQLQLNFYFNFFL